MKQTFLLSILAFPLLLFSQNQIPDVEIVNVDNDLNNNELTVTYNLFDAENDECSIVVFLSENGGVTFPWEVMATGDQGSGIPPGMNKVVKFNYGEQMANLAVKILAMDGGSFDIEEIISKIDSNELKNQLSFFQGIRHRVTGAEHLEATKDSIENAFENAGLEWESFPFNLGSYEAKNIEGTLRGTVFDGDYLMVGGHFDSVFDSPGADDNGSAIVGMLEALRILKDYRFQKTIKFIGFDLEEEGLDGSIHYTGNNLHPDEDCNGFFDFEMIGYYSNQPGSQSLPTGFEILFPDVLAELEADSFRGNFINVVGNTENSFELQNSFETIGKQHVPDLKIIGLSAPGTGVLTPDLLRSDHVPFWLAGLPAVMITDGANFRNPHYHGPNDVLDSLNFTFMSKVVKATIATIVELAEPHHANYDIAVFGSTVGLNEIKKERIKVYPNPASKGLWVETENPHNSIENLKVFDVMGKEIFSSEDVNQPKINLSIEQLVSGAYILQVIVNEQIINKIFIVD